MNRAERRPTGGEGGGSVARAVSIAPSAKMYEEIAAKINEGHLTEILRMADRAERRALHLALLTRCMLFVAGAAAVIAFGWLTAYLVSSSHDELYRQIIEIAVPFFSGFGGGFGTGFGYRRTRGRE